MKKLFIFLIFFVSPASIVHAAEPVEKPCTGDDYRQLDFWIGAWKVTWEGGAGTNRITRTYGGCVIHEDFKAPTFKGISLSMFDKTGGQWRQTWMDDEGSYFDFYGRKDGDDFIFQTMPNPKNLHSKQRMIFTNIKKNSLTWLWQKTTDGGKSWREMWKIHYSRIE